MAPSSRHSCPLGFSEATKAEKGKLRGQQRLSRQNEPDWLDNRGIIDTRLTELGVNYSNGSTLNLEPPSHSRQLQCSYCTMELLLKFRDDIIPLHSSTPTCPCVCVCKGDGGAGEDEPTHRMMQ